MRSRAEPSAIFKINFNLQMHIHRCTIQGIHAHMPVVPSSFRHTRARVHCAFTYNTRCNNLSAPHTLAGPHENASLRMCTLKRRRRRGSRRAAVVSHRLRHNRSISFSISRCARSRTGSRSVGRSLGCAQQCDCVRVCVCVSVSVWHRSPLTQSHQHRPTTINRPTPNRRAQRQA